MTAKERFEKLDKLYTVMEEIRVDILSDRLLTTEFGDIAEPFSKLHGRLEFMISFFEEDKDMEGAV